MRPKTLIKQGVGGGGGGWHTAGQPVVQTRMEQSAPPQPMWQWQEPWKQSPWALQSLSSAVVQVR